MRVFNFCQFDYYVSQCVLPWVYPSWDSLCFLDLVDYFLSHVQEVFSYYLFKYFLKSYLSCPSGAPIMWMLVCLMFSQRSPEQSFFFILFFFPIFSFAVVISAMLFSKSLSKSLSVLLPKLSCHQFLLVYCSSLFVCSLVLPGLW